MKRCDLLKEQRIMKYALTEVVQWLFEGKDYERIYYFLPSIQLFGLTAVCLGKMQPDCTFHIHVSWVTFFSFLIHVNWVTFFSFDAYIVSTYSLVGYVK